MPASGGDLAPNVQCHQSGDGMSTLLKLNEHGQSVWLDDIGRGLIKGGGLGRLIAQDGITGVATTPAHFAAAISQGSHYDDAVERMLEVNPRVVNRLLAERLVIEDLQQAAVVLRPVYDVTGGADGFVTVDISPAYARDAAATVAEARRLWFEVARPNLMINVPATPQAISAVEILIAQGININVTLAFSLEHYEAFAQAYLRGIARHAEPRHVSSVISVPVSVLDAAINRLLAAIDSPGARGLRNNVAIANARQLYRRFRALFHGKAFAEEARRGAHVQRLLWGSAGVEDEAHSVARYLEALFARDTVAAAKPATIDAFRQCGRVIDVLDADPADESAVLIAAENYGLNLPILAGHLQRTALAMLTASHEQLLMTVDRKRRLMTSTSRSLAAQSLS